MQTGKQLLIIADDIEGEVMAALVVNKLRGSLKVAAVKAPAYGELRKAMMQDIALLTGGTVISEALGLKLENVSLDLLGRTRKVTIGKQNTTIVGGAGKQADIDARVREIRFQLEKGTSIEENDIDYDRDKLQERLARLTGGIAVIRVGGSTEVEVRERKDRIRNAVHATRAAVEEGILPGGGVALLRASHAIADLKTDNADQNAGIAIVRDAITWPARQIAINAGAEGSTVVAKILKSSDGAFGYDAQSGQYGDLVSMGVIDPVQSRALGPSGGSLGSWPSYHDGSHGGRDSRSTAAGASRPSRSRRSSRHGVLTRKLTRQPQPQSFLNEATNVFVISNGRNRGVDVMCVTCDS